MLTNLAYLTDRSHLKCVCGSTGGATFRRRDRYGLKFNFKICKRCGHVRIGNPLSESAAIRFYSSSDYRSLYFLGEASDSVLTRKTPAPNTKSELLAYVESLGVLKGRIVEWGCGGGWNLVPFRDAGWSTFGFDFDQTYVRLGRELLGLELFEIESLPAVRQLVSEPEIILMNHVIEHVVNPAATFLQLRELCSDATVLIVGVPLLETIKIWHWKDFFHVAHIHYFSSRTFTRTATNSGFRVIHANVPKGIFALKKVEATENNVYRPLWVVHSAFLLWMGFIEPAYRFKRFISICLHRFGLIGIARRIRRRLV